MSLSDAQLKQYWITLSALRDRLVGSTRFLRTWASEIPAGEVEADPLGGVAADLARVIGPLGRGGTSRSGRLAGSDLDDFARAGQQLVTPGDNRFISGLKLLVEELTGRLHSFPESPHKHDLLSLLTSDVHELAARFGSFTAAWDGLVILKYETSIPNQQQRKLDAWFMALVGVAERFIRDVIRVTVEHTARDLVKEPLLRSLTASDLNLPNPTVAQVMESTSTEAVLTDIVTSYMDRSGWHTTRYAERFATNLGTTLFPPEEAGFAPGILTEIPFLGETTEDAWANILSLRNSMIHESTKDPRALPVPDPHEILYELDQHNLQILADFLCAFTFGFSTRLLVAVAERAAGGEYDSLVAGLRRQFSGELRVLVMRLLTSKRYGLAWAIAEAALAAEPVDSRGDMLRLNAFFARQNLGRGYVERQEIENFPVSPLPRYRILKAVLLSELSQKKLEPLLNQAVTSHDVTIKELETWPALERLRGRPWWSTWVQRQATA